MTTSTLINATPHDVRYLDGRTETLQLGRLSIRQLYTFTHHLTAERVPELVALCAGKSPEWVDELEDASFSELARVCVKLNFPRAMTLGESDPVIAAKLQPLLHKLQVSLVLAELGGMHSHGSSPAPAASASAAATGSASSTSHPSGSASSSTSTAASTPNASSPSSSPSTTASPEAPPPTP